MNSLPKTAAPIVNKFITNISTKYDIDEDDLIELFENCSIKLKPNKDSVKQKCKHIFKKGKSEGEQCTAIAVDNGYCNKHKQKVKVNDNVKTTKKTNKTNKTNKTDIGKDSILSKIKRDKVKRIDKDEDGDFKDENDFIFEEKNKKNIVIGKKINKSIKKLTKNDKAVCNQLNYDYENSDSNSDNLSYDNSSNDSDDNSDI